MGVYGSVVLKSNNLLRGTTITARTEHSYQDRLIVMRYEPKEGQHSILTVPCLHAFYLSQVTGEASRVLTPFREEMGVDEVDDKIKRRNCRRASQVLVMIDHAISSTAAVRGIDLKKMDHEASTVGVNNVNNFLGATNALLRLFWPPRPGAKIVPPMDRMVRHRDSFFGSSVDRIQSNMGSFTIRMSLVTT